MFGDTDFDQADYDELTEMIREDRLASEFCASCLTRHHPAIDCVDVDLD